MGPDGLSGLTLKQRVYAALMVGVDLPPLTDLFGPRPAWMADALCREHPGVSFFPRRGESAKEAKAICGRCPVRQECLTYALAETEYTPAGIWGATSPNERQALNPERRRTRRQPPCGTAASWRRGCHCPSCTEANRLYRAEQYQRSKERQSA